MKNFTRYRTIELLELLAGSVLPIIFWGSLIFGFDEPYVAILTLISALMHEIGHIVAIRIFAKAPAKLRGHSSGFRISLSEPISYNAEIAVLLLGPGVNILTFLLLLPFGSAMNGYLRFFGYISLATGISNLLPIEGYDGYRALYSYLISRDKFRALSVLEGLSFGISIGAVFISLHLIDVLSEGYWIFGLFFVTSMSKILNLGKYDNLRE